MSKSAPSGVGAGFGLVDDEGPIRSLWAIACQWAWGLLSVNQEPGVPESRVQASNPSRGAIPRSLLREVKKIESRERALGAIVSGP